MKAKYSCFIYEINCSDYYPICLYLSPTEFTIKAILEVLSDDIKESKAK